MSNESNNSDQTQSSLEQLLGSLGVKTWDMLLVGDGSGSRWGYECGWASVAVLPDEMKRYLFFGGLNCGTVNIAEMMAYMTPLLWFEARERAKSQDGRPPKAVYHIHILTDSEYVEQRGEGGQLNFKRNQALWAVFEMFNRRGFMLHWHWKPRDTTALNKLSDCLSKLSRNLIKDNTVELQTKMLQAGFDPDQCNPFQ